MSNQGRTAESDANFRKSTAPKGSVTLTNRAQTAIRTLMQQAQGADDEDCVATLIWTTSRSEINPGDKDWTEYGPGLSLGGYPRAQIPPDIVDIIGGVEIIFAAEDPSVFVGKMIDFQNDEFFVVKR